MELLKEDGLNEKYLQHIKAICDEDAAGLLKAHESYGNSWKKRGGAGAYLIMVRKFDRLEQTLPKFGYDVFQAVAEDVRAEGVIDDIRDARRYLCLIEAEMRARGSASATSTHRDNTGETADNEYPSDHIPDGHCNCHACRAMKELTNPHPENCQCVDCQIGRGL